MSNKVPSLSIRLTAVLVLFHFVVACLMLAAIAYYIERSQATSVDDRLITAIADSMLPATTTSMTFTPTQKLKGLADLNQLWFIARREDGVVYEHGAVPPIYRDFANQLPLIQRAEIHGIRGKEELAAQSTRVRDMDILVGGVTIEDGLGTFFAIIRAFGLKIIIPPILVAMLVIPFLVRRELKGILQLAGQARRIRMNKRDEPLPETSVPREIAPFVEAVNAAISSLHDSYEVRERFLVGAAHELRAPIAILETRIALLPQGDIRKSLQRDTARLVNLAEQLLDLQRIGKSATDLCALDLDTLALDVVSDMVPLVLAGGQEIELERSSKPVFVNGDALALSRVLFNLIQNAIRHGAAQGTITVRVLDEGAIEVSDDGDGIDPDEREQIFEPFYRVAPSSEGSGLGLHLVREIVELHEGRVEVMDSVTTGATFRVSIPLQRRSL